jgi:hypothetical protein
MVPAIFREFNLPPMQDNLYRVAFKDPNLPDQLIKAVTVEIHGEHLIFLTATADLSALFLLEIIDSWELKSLHF